MSKKIKFCFPRFRYRNKNYVSLAYIIAYSRIEEYVLVTKDFLDLLSVSSHIHSVFTNVSNVSMK